MDWRKLTEEERVQYLLEFRIREAKETLGKKIPVDAPEEAIRYTNEIEKILITIAAITDDNEKLWEKKRKVSDAIRQKKSRNRRAVPGKQSLHRAHPEQSPRTPRAEPTTANGIDRKTRSFTTSRKPPRRPPNR